MFLNYELEESIRRALEDRLEAWELVDFLQISTKDIIDAFEDLIIEKLEDVLEFAQIDDFIVKDDEEDYDD